MLTNPQDRFAFLAHETEQIEYQQAVEGLGLLIAQGQRVARSEKQVVKLRRTFNMKAFDGSIIRFWRVVGPIGHPNYCSDLSIDGLKDWGII